MPKVNKKILVLVAGILWTSVGLLLMRIASKWFSLLSNTEIVFAIIGGIILGSAISHFGFSNLAQKNINRINLYPNKVCIWAFQRWQMYFLVIFMISLGIVMRHTPFIPKFLLTPMYIGIGFALFSASFKYYTFLVKKVIEKQ